jgi:hypothetical protein
VRNSQIFANPVGAVLNATAKANGMTSEMSDCAYWTTFGCRKDDSRCKN